MKYRPTPLNITSAVAIGFSIYAAIHDAITPGSEGFGFLMLFFFSPSGIIGLTVDYFLQKISKKYVWTFIVESCLLGFLFLYYSSKQGKKTLIIPDHLEQPYIVTIYGVDSAPELPNGLLSWNPQIKVPENGILLTSTSIENDLPDTRWFTTSGIDLQNPNDSTDMYVGHVRTGSVKCSEKEFKYQIWKLVDKRWTTGPLSRELDSLELMLTDYLCKK